VIREYLMSDLLKQIADRLDSYDPENVSGVLEDVKEAVAQGFAPGEILGKGLLAGLSRVGAKFKLGEVFIPEVLIVARAVRESMGLLSPHMIQGEIKPRGRIVLGTVKGDLHDIGKNLVGIMLEGAGLEIIDIGTNVPAERFIESVKENDADIVGLSSLLTTTMMEMKTVIGAFKSAGLNTKIIVGGAPITQEFANEIGADAYAVNAGDAVEKVADLLGSN
jgi:5-methyltetrahydrofolate--homocysteine methyltransferase